MPFKQVCPVASLFRYGNVSESSSVTVSEGNGLNGQQTKKEQKQNQILTSHHTKKIDYILSQFKRIIKALNTKIQQFRTFRRKRTKPLKNCLIILKFKPSK